MMEIDPLTSTSRFGQIGVRVMADPATADANAPAAAPEKSRD
jgi:hypothetical protein